MKNVTDIYSALNAGIVELNEFERIKNSRLAECNGYYQCVQQNKACVDKYQSISVEISNNFDNQQFNLHELQTGFTQIGILDGKLSRLQMSMDDILKFLKPEDDSIANLSYRYCENLGFQHVNEAILNVDRIFYDLQKAKEDAEERRRRRIERWKTAGKIAWTIIKYAAMLVGFIFVIIGAIIKIFASNKDD